MRSFRIKTTDFTEATTATFPAKFTEIVQAIIAHIMLEFMGCPIPQMELEAAQASIISKTSAAENGSRESKDQRDIQRAICTAQLLQLSNFVLTVASKKPTEEEQIAIVNLSKFTLAKFTHEPLPPLPQVSGVQGKWTGNIGEALIEWDRIPSGVLLYQVEKCLTDPSNPSATWQTAGVTSHKKLVLSDLPSRSWVRVIAYGKAGEASVPSSAVMCLIV